MIETLKKSIKCLSREQENRGTEIKLRRAMMDLHEKHSELIITMNARRIKRLTDQLDREETVPVDVEVEKNEHNMLVKIEDELRELNYDLINCLLERL